MHKPLLLLLAALLLTTPALAGNDSSIKGQLRSDIQQAMNEHIDATRIGDQYVIYDPITGSLQRLTFKKLHKGIVKKGDFYVSCADFVDHKGTLIDVDFLVASSEDGVRVYQAVIHAVGKSKRKYHLEG